MLAGVAVTTGLLAVLTWLPALVGRGGAGRDGAGDRYPGAGDRGHRPVGIAHYGPLSGVLAAPLTFTTALAPFLGAALAALLGGYATMLIVMAAVGLAAAALSLGSLPPPPATRARLS